MKTTPVKSNRILILFSLLAAAVLALGVTRWRANSLPTTPPQNTTVSEKMRFYRERLKADETDRTAYTELGKLEESTEFYIRALRHLYAARALGVPETEIILPIGRSLSRLSRWDEARDELTKAVALMPDSVEAIANLSGVYYGSGYAKEASRVLMEFVDRHRNPDRTIRLPAADLQRLMLCFSEARDTAKAGEIAREILRTTPNDAGALSIAGHALVSADKFREALPYLEKAAALEPDQSSLCYNYGLALKNCGREEDALKQFQKCVVLNPNATDGFVELAGLYEKKKDWKLASVAMSNAAVRSKSNHFVLYRTGKLNEKAGNKDEANYWYSCAALAAGKYPDALTFAEKLFTSSDAAWRNAGFRNAADAYTGLHKVSDYLAMIKRSASGGTAQDDLLLAEAYEKADLLEKQVETLKSALSKEPKFAPLIHYTIAATYLRRGLRDDAEKELELAIAADPKNSDYRTELANVYFARRDKDDRLKKAIAEYKEAVRLNPRESSYHQNLGIAYTAAADYGAAAFSFEHAIDLEPGYGPSYQELGRVYAKMGDKEGSEKMLGLYRKYVRHDLRLKNLTAKANQNKESAEAQIELADLLTRTGDLTAALQRYGDALQIKPQDRETQAKYDRILELLTRKKVTANKARY